MYSDLGWKLRMKSKYSRVCKGYRLFALRSVGTNGYVLCLLRSNFALRRLSNDSDLLLSSGRDPGLVRFPEIDNELLAPDRRWVMQGPV